MLKSGKVHARVVAEGLVILALAGWWGFSVTVPEYVLPGPQKVFPIVVRLLFDPDLAYHVYVSLLRVLAATVISLIIGMALALGVLHVPAAGLFVEQRLIPFLNSFPALGWAIMGVIWFGVSSSAVIFIETAILVPFAMINLWEGLKAIDEETTEMARSFTRSQWRVTWKVVLPLLFPHLFAALRIAYGVGWKVSLIAELFGTSAGLGFLFNLARQRFDMALVVGCILVIILLVFVVDRLLLRWIHARLSQHLQG